MSEIRKYGMTFSSTQEMREWEIGEVYLSIMNDESCYNLYESRKFREAINMAQGIAGVELIQRDFGKLRESLEEEWQEDFA